MSNQSLVQVLARINEIPTLPASILQVMHKLEDPRCSASDVAHIVTSDPSMTTKILKLANSAYYGFREKISSLNQAISLLGFGTVKNALTSTAVFDLYQISGTGFDMPGLWKHSVATASAAKMIARRVRFPNPEMAFTAGLLHDVGKVLIARHMPASLAEIVRKVENEELTMYQAEQQTIVLSHPAIGGYVLKGWGFPTAIVEAIEFHHSPAHATNAFDLACIVYLADVLAHRAELGNGGDSRPRGCDPSVLKLFHLDQHGIQELTQMLLAKKLEIEAFISVASSA